MDFDLEIGDGDEYMDSSMGPDMLSFHLDLNAPTISSTGAANAFNSGSHPSMVPQQQSIESSVEAEANTLPQSDRKQPSGPAVVGAGPLPHSYGVQLAPGTGSTVTEFTKRRNWSQRIIEELRDFLYILSPDGRLLYVSPSVNALTGYESTALVGKLISEYIHPDDSNVFIREFNESIASGNPLRFFYRFLKKDGQYSIFESHGHPHLAPEAANFGQDAGPAICRGFFMMARPYPTKNAALLDSFLEHKIENERLRKRIADLKREEREDMETQQQVWFNKQVNPSANSSQSPGHHLQHSDRPSATPDYNGMPPPARPTISNTALTRQNLDEALASSRPDSINDKMARYEGNNHLETIEMLTGLRYREGERSKGISTGAASPTLMRGDAGIAIYVDKDGRPAQGGRANSGSPYGESTSGDKKKKLKVADEYVCTDCGTLDSPEWRKGPNGPKTLCNACGLRWAKKEKKRSGAEPGSGNGHASGQNSLTPVASQESSVPATAQPASMMGQNVQSMGVRMDMTGAPQEEVPGNVGSA